MSNNIVPFFWQHGDSKEELLKMIEVMQSAHINAFCVESRTHDGFCEDKWWDDFGFVLQEAKKRGMKVWAFDDKHYPSGRANGYLEKHPELARQVISEHYTDVAGPMKQACFLTNRCEGNQKLLYVLAYRRAENGDLISDTCVNLTDHVKDDLLIWDVPEGCWRVFFIILEWGGTYINMLSEESCHAMIDGVLQPHFDNLSEYFGDTLLGFFSDEPRFNNEGTTYVSKLGRLDVPIPWVDGLLTELAAEIGRTEEETLALLPGLWHDLVIDTDVIRNTYMEVASKRYSKCFCGQLGDWCREHGVEYIGHVIEDNNAHMRLGPGSGHFFRALKGQDMSGIDVVLCQIMPGLTDMKHHIRSADNGVADAEFFDYTLAKLGASAAHLDPKKKNRCMCEIFGAYGWAEGLSTMKYLADHMIVNGVNFFIPHAFTNRFPLADSPPHFWADGTNPQFAYFGDLMDYMNRCIDLLAESTHCADVAVYYNAEGEWCGGDYMLFQKVCKVLTRNQIDFDIVPQDSLRDDAGVKNGRLYIGSESYGALVVSYSEILPKHLLDLFADLAQQGLPIIFANGLPKGAKKDSMVAMPLDEIPRHLANVGLKRFFLKEPNPNLRFYHVKRGEEDVVMFFNDNIHKDLHTILQLPFAGELLWYDPWTGKRYRSYTQDGNVELHLPRYSTMFLMTGGPENGDLPMLKRQTTESYKPELLYDIYVQEAGEEERCYAEKSELFNISAKEDMSRFCGTMRYKTAFTLTDAATYTELDLGVVGETAEVHVNGEHCGLRIQEPYRFDVAGMLQDGENTLEILVANTPFYKVRDQRSWFMAAAPSGLLGDVILYR